MRINQEFLRTTYYLPLIFSVALFFGGFPTDALSQTSATPLAEPSIDNGTPITDINDVAVAGLLIRYQHDDGIAYASAFGLDDPLFSCDQIIVTAEHALSSSHDIESVGGTTGTHVITDPGDQFQVTEFAVPSEASGLNLEDTDVAVARIAGICLPDRVTHELGDAPTLYEPVRTQGVGRNETTDTIGQVHEMEGYATTLCQNNPVTRQCIINANGQAVNGGDSGSPVFDENGTVAGVMTKDGGEYTSGQFDTMTGQLKNWINTCGEALRNGTQHASCVIKKIPQYNYFIPFIRKR